MCQCLLNTGSGSSMRSAADGTELWIFYNTWHMRMGGSITTAIRPQHSCSRDPRSSHLEKGVEMCVTHFVPPPSWGGGGGDYKRT